VGIREPYPGGILPRGTVLQNRYEIIRVLGVGGMGAVYEARDRRFPNVVRLCAVKEMINTASEPSLRRISQENFEREASILASLSHPAIPKVFDYFSEGDRSYLVLEFIHGKDLEAILRETDGFLPEKQVLEWGIQICDVLSYLHNHKPNPIIFRDLKPSNIMLNDQGRIVLVDFGIAKVFQAGRRGTMIGTEGYSPPEQYRGIAEPRSDIYALGATLHHLLTRQDPQREPPFTFHERPPRSINPHLSPLTEAAIMKALEYDIDKRFSSVEEMKEALLKALRQVSGLAAPSTSPFIITDKAEEGEVIPAWSFACEDEVRSSPRVSQGIVYIGSYDHNLYALSAKTGELIWKYPTEGGIASTPCVWKNLVFVGSEDQVLYAISVRTGRIAWTCPTGGCVRSSPRVTYEHVFFGSDDGNLYVVHALSGRVAWKFQTAGPVRSSPAVGERAVYVGSDDGHVYALDLQSGKMLWRYYTRRRVVSSPALALGLVFVGSLDGCVYALDDGSGWAVWRFRTGRGIVSSPTLDEERLYIGSADGHLYALDAESGRLLWKYATEGQVVSTPALAGEAVYFGSTDGHVYSLDAKTGKLRWRFKTGGAVVSSPAVAGDLVYIGSVDHHLYALPL